MRALTRGFALAALVTLCASPVGAQQREVQPVERVAAITRPAIVYLEVFWEGWLRDRRDGKLWLKESISTGATCSGSLVTSNGYVLTAGHCVEAELVFGDLVQGVVDAYIANGDVDEADRQSFYDEVWENSDAEGDGDEGAELVPKVTVYRGIVEKGERAGDAFDAEVIDMLSFANSKGDTALLKLDGAKGLPTIELSDETDIGVGTPIVAIGYPGSVSQIVDPTLEPTFKDGTVSAQRTQQGIPFYEVSAAATPGMSGGPVVDLEGRVIGIVSQSPTEESQSFNLMVSVSIALEMLRDNDVQRSPGPNDETYRQGLDQLFDGKYRDAVESFDAVLAKDPKHQQAYEIKQQAVKRAAGDTGGGGGFPLIALLPLLIGAAGVVSVMRRRKPEPASTAPEAAPTPVAALVCPSCGFEHARPVTFCTKCGVSMGGAPATPASSGRSSRDRVVLIGSGAAVVVAALVVVFARGGDEGGVLPTPSPTAAPVERAEGPDLNGTWESSYGPVTLEHDEVSGDDPVSVTGSWIQGPDKEGEITEGTFDPDAGTLEISYVETWNGTEGTASFELSDDGDTLDGTYVQPDSRGAWVLTR